MGRIGIFEFVSRLGFGFKRLEMYKKGKDHSKETEGGKQGNQNM